MIEVKGPERLQGLLAHAGEDRRGVQAGRLLHHRRPRQIDARGYVHIVGRGKDLIISGGYNVYPKEVEGEIDAMPGVDESAVIGVPHPDFGEGVTAVVVAGQARDRRTSGSIPQRSRIAWRGSSSRKRIFFVDELPRNTMGKVQKNVLREQYTPRLSRLEITYCGPASHTWRRRARHRHQLQTCLDRLRPEPALISETCQSSCAALPSVGFPTFSSSIRNPRRLKCRILRNSNRFFNRQRIHSILLPAWLRRTFLAPVASLPEE